MATKLGRLVGKMRLTLVVDIPVDDLADYGEDATNMQEAVDNQKQWVDDGDVSLDDLMSCGDVVEWKLEVAPEEKA